MKPDLKIRFAGIEFANPVLVASGTFNYGLEMTRFYPLSQLGGIVTKSITKKARPGHPYPRTFETKGGMLNAIGLANPGIDKFLSEKMPFLRKVGTRLVVNIAGSSIEEFVELAGRLSDIEGIDAIEVNISCPNVKEGGLEFSATPEPAFRVLSAVRKATQLPLIAKLSPNTADIVKRRRIGSAVGPHDERDELRGTSAGRDLIEQIAREGLLLLDVRDVHHGSLPRNSDRLLDASHFHLAIHGRGKPRAQRDPAPDEGAEARQRERDGVHTGPQIDDAVEALAVRDDGADLFDQGRAGGFNGDAGQHRARSVSDDAGNVAGFRLRPCDSRQGQHAEHHDDATREGPESHHLSSFGACETASHAHVRRWVRKPSTAI